MIEPDFEALGGTPFLLRREFIGLLEAKGGRHLTSVKL